MLQATAHVEIKFKVTCPHCKCSNTVEDNWDIREDHPLMQGMVDRFTKDTDNEYPTLITKDWIEQAKHDGYDNPYVCQSCGADFEIAKVNY